MILLMVLEISNANFNEYIADYFIIIVTENQLHNLLFLVVLIVHCK